MKKGIVALPKSATPARIKSNLSGTLSALAKLTDEDVKVLDGIAASGLQRRFITPPWGAHFNCFLLLKTRTIRTDDTNVSHPRIVIDLGFENWP